ncbi:hypothetical protein DRN52_02715 [Thermococci archaeon]|nr:MAG: hypothetical protein DRN52_02715 [Thermococci archaeon]
MRIIVSMITLSLVLSIIPSGMGEEASDLYEKELGKYLELQDKIERAHIGQKAREYIKEKLKIAKAILDSIKDEGDSLAYFERLARVDGLLGTLESYLYLEEKNATAEEVLNLLNSLKEEAYRLINETRPRREFGSSLLYYQGVVYYRMGEQGEENRLIKDAIASYNMAISYVTISKYVKTGRSAGISKDVAELAVELGIREVALMTLEKEPMSPYYSLYVYSARRALEEGYYDVAFYLMAYITTLVDEYYDIEEEPKPVKRSSNPMVEFNVDSHRIMEEIASKLDGISKKDAEEKARIHSILAWKLSEIFGDARSEDTKEKKIAVYGEFKGHKYAKWRLDGARQVDLHAIRDLGIKQSVSDVEWLTSPEGNVTVYSVGGPNVNGLTRELVQYLGLFGKKSLFIGDNRIEGLNKGIFYVYFRGARKYYVVAGVGGSGTRAAALGKTSGMPILTPRGVIYIYELEGDTDLDGERDPGEDWEVKEVYPWA